MKKLLVMAAMAIMVSTAANAQIGESQSKKIQTTYTTTTTTTTLEKSPAKGYSGMLDFTYGVGVGDAESSRVGLSTVHGYQINPYIFVGGGLAVNYFYDDELVNIPFFADARATLPLGTSPVALYFDYRIGYAAGDVSGFYMSPSVGVRFGRNAAFTLSIGYEMQNCDITYYDGYYYRGDYYYNSYTDTGNAGAINFRLGIEW